MNYAAHAYQDYTLHTPDEATMVVYGSYLGQAVQGVSDITLQGLVIFLQGDLGMGKTTLVRGCIHACGYVGSVKSPTYTLIEPYQLEHIHINHFDLYRLSHPEELEFLGIRDYFVAPQINLVEWPERGQVMLPKADISISITSDTRQRHLHCQPYSHIGKQVMIQWQQLADSKQRAL